MPTFTVFTPTYNRARTLPRVYASLRRQTTGDFEWLVVDDGSTDETRALIEAWRKEADFPVRYARQANQGKHVAHNLAVTQARGDLFLPLDSDDECVPAALATLKQRWDEIPAAQRAGFSSVHALAMTPDGRVIGDRFPRDPTDSDALEAMYRLRVRGDKWGFQRTDVLRAHPFPVADGMRFVPEQIVWSAIGKSYRTRFVNDVLLVVHTDGADRLSAAAPADHARGMALWCAAVLNDQLDWFRFAPADFLRAAVNYTRFGLHDGRGLPAQARGLSGPLGKLLWAAGAPAGLAAYLRDRLRR
jgi:glycosyltransferase involved in cell wall biosynthesis